MIDPITAFAAAQGAVKGIKAAIKLGKDVGEIGGQLQSFFENKDIVTKAADKEKKAAKKKNIEQQALANVMKARQLREAEAQLKETLYWSGNADLYHEILNERAKLTRERKLAEARAIAKRKLLIDRIDTGIGIMFILGVGFGSVWYIGDKIYEMGAAAGRW